MSSIRRKQPRIRSHFVSPFLALYIAACALILASAYPRSIYAVDITLAWDENIGENPAGYRVFHREDGESYDYEQPAWEGEDTTCTIYGLTNNTVHYFVARAFDGSDYETEDSNETFYTPNAPPVLDPIGNKSVNEGELLEFMVTATDPDGDSLTYAASNLPTGASFNATTHTFTWTPGYGQEGSYTNLLFTVTDDGTPPVSDSETMTITVGDVNQPPVAHAGSDQTADEGDPITLDGSGSYDPDGTTLFFNWSQTAGTQVMLSDVSAAQPTFSAPDVGPGGESLAFQLTVTDAYGLESSDTCTVHILWVDDSPILTSVSMSGASSVNENTTSNYTATATFSDGSSQDVTGTAIWSADSLYASINTSGELSASEVTSDQDITITASYTDGTVTETAQKVVTILDIPEANLPPWPPVITAPYEGQMECELQTHIVTEPFSDPDNDPHAQSQWQISREQDFDPLTLDVTSTTQRTQLTVPHLLLEADATYYVRVRFYDVYLEASDWSDTVEFTTAADNNDVDDNGIPDAQEVGAGIDLNEDGIADNDQVNLIKCAQSPDGSVIIGVCKVSDSLEAIEAVETIDPATLSDKPDDLLFGLFCYRIRVNPAGTTATVRIYFSEDISNASTFYKYDTIRGWQDYSNHATFHTDGRSISLELKDGDYGDCDGTANGVIVDPGGVAGAMGLDEVETATETPAPATSGAGESDGGGSGGGCFIETAGFF